MDKEKLARRYRSLWTGEAVSSALFISLFLYFAARNGQWSHWILRGYSLAVVVFILIQAISWWRWKLHLLAQGARDMPPHVVARFRRLRTLNWLLIAAFALVFLLRLWLTGRGASGPDFWVGLLILGGAVLEQINYYHYQLMYDNPYDWNHLRTQRSLRRGSIAKVLERQGG